MRNRMTLHWIATTLTILILTAGTVPSFAYEDTVIRDADSAYKKGMVSYKRGEWWQAVEKLKESYSLIPFPMTAYLVSSAASQARDSSTARQYAGKALNNQPPLEKGLRSKHRLKEPFISKANEIISWAEASDKVVVSARADSVGPRPPTVKAPADEIFMLKPSTPTSLYTGVLERQLLVAEGQKRKEEAYRLADDAVLRGSDGAAIYKIVRNKFDRFASNSLVMKVTDEVENGAVVPVTLDVKSAVPGRFWLFAEQNDDPVVASFNYHIALGSYKFSSRIKMCRRGYIYGVFIPVQGEPQAVRRSVNPIGGSCQPESGNGPVIGDLKVRAKKGVFKLILKSPMTREAYIRTLEIRGDGNPVATLTASPMMSKNLYLSGNYPRKLKSLTIKLKGSDGSRKQQKVNTAQ